MLFNFLISILSEAEDLPWDWQIQLWYNGLSGFWQIMVWVGFGAFVASGFKALVKDAIKGALADKDKDKQNRKRSTTTTKTKSNLYGILIVIVIAAGAVIIFGRI